MLEAQRRPRRLAPGTRLKTISKIKDYTVSADSRHPRFSAQNGVTAGIPEAEKRMIRQSSGRPEARN